MRMRRLVSLSFYLMAGLIMASGGRPMYSEAAVSKPALLQADRGQDLKVEGLSENLFELWQALTREQPLDLLRKHFRPNISFAATTSSLRPGLLMISAARMSRAPSAASPSMAVAASRDFSNRGGSLRGRRPSDSVGHTPWIPLAWDSCSISTRLRRRRPSSSSRAAMPSSSWT